MRPQQGGWEGGTSWRWTLGWASCSTDARPWHVSRDLLPSPLAEWKGPEAGLRGDPACVSAGSGGRTPGSSLRSSGTLSRKCPSRASSVTTPTSRRSRCTPSRPTTTHMTLWIAQPLISWISHPGPPGRIRGPDSTASHCAVELSLATMPFQVDSVSGPCGLPTPSQAFFPAESLHDPTHTLLKPRAVPCLSSSSS